MRSVPDGLSEALDHAFRALTLSVADERSPLRTPSLATCRPAVMPSLRLVVLRAFDPAGPSLRFHTDRRSAKVGELSRDERCALLAYDPATWVQLRLEGRGTLHFGGLVLDEAWAASRGSSRLAYGVEPAPGLPIAEGSAYVLPESDGGRSQFCVVTVRLQRLEWLHLARNGHRRAAFEFAENGTVRRCAWLVP